MPAAKGYGTKHMTDRTKNPGKVKSGKHTFEAHGAQAPLGTITMKRKGKKPSY